MNDNIQILNEDKPNSKLHRGDKVEKEREGKRDIIYIDPNLFIC